VKVLKIRLSSYYNVLLASKERKKGQRTRERESKERESKEREERDEKVKERE
jgi:hypothetical protein